MVQYDREIIQQYAEALYRMATATIINHALFYGVIFGGLAWWYGRGLFARTGDEIALIGAVIGIVIGVYIGSGKAFQYKLQAQIALCQVQIEVNTARQQSGTE